MNSAWNPDKLTVEAYTQADCYLLALALHDLTGWPLIVGAYKDGEGPQSDGKNQDGHVAVLHPSGKVLDVEGLADNVPQNWACYGVDYGRVIAREELDVDGWGGPVGEYDGAVQSPLELALDLYEVFA